MFDFRAGILLIITGLTSGNGIGQNNFDIINIEGNTAANEYGAIWTLNELIFNQNEELKNCVSFDSFIIENTKDIARNTSFVSTNRGKNLIALTLTNFTGRAAEIEQGLLRMKLIIGKLKVDKSISPDRYQLFPHQLPDYNYGFPCFSPDGNKLFFVADIPGGYGGLDIYVSRASVGGWTFPENLGPTINTPGNEVTPFFDGTALIFASDGYTSGNGKFDLYKSKWNAEEFEQSTPLPHPFNTAYHDWGYYDGGLAVLISSDRPGGIGGFDLYAIRPNESEPKPQHKAQVSNEYTYAIQLAALEEVPDLKKFKALELYGSLFYVEENGMYKVKLGSFESRGVAMETIGLIKEKGFSGFVVEGLDPMEYNYRIQLAAYQEIKWFNAILVEDLGKLESEIKGNLTIQLLTEIEDLEQAENLLFEAKKRGFSDAFIQHKVDYGWERLKNGY